MDIVLLLFRQSLVMFIYLLIGCLMFKKHLLTTQGSGEMGKLLLYVITPVVIMNSYAREFTPQMLTEILLSFAAAAGSLLLSMTVSTLVFKKRSAICQFGASFSNAGFMGIPLVQMTLGDGAVFYVVSFVALLNILQWTFGVYSITKDPATVSLKRIATNPVVLGLAAGLLLFFLPIPVPQTVRSVMSTLASMNGPVAMLVIGSYLAQMPLRELFTSGLTYLCCLVRLIAIPLLTIALLTLIPAGYITIRLAVLIVASAPVGANVAIFAQMFHKDYTGAVRDICLSTVLSIASMPLIVGLANMVWM